MEVVLVGDAARICGELRHIGAREESRVHVHHASQAVTMDDAPGQVFRQKPDSSLRVACELVKTGQADAVVSAGHSGAILSHAVLVLGRLPNVERPGIITALPSPTGKCVLCDVGANVAIKPAVLAQFAVLGACYDHVVHGHARPRVAILSNGVEANKGTELTRAADALLRAAGDGQGFRYCGYVEASHLFDGKIDVVATDGFTGNVVLKLSEGIAEALFRMIKAELVRTTRSRVGAALIAPAMRELKRSIDYAETGGALLAGVPGVVTICHGRSDVNAIKNAVKAAFRFARAQLPARLGQAINRQGELWQVSAASAERA